MKKLPVLFFILVVVAVFGWFLFLISQVDFQVLNPMGLIADGERDLIITAMSIMLIVAIPVVFISFFVAWRYRIGGKSKQTSEEAGSPLIVATYWVFLTEFVLIFFFIVWQSAHQLDPHKPINSSVKPITVQVVALDWKWLFIYPEEGIATVNFLEIPVNTPISFKLTAEGPMNSFWIPSLGGQIYSMATMETKLHLIANKTGDFDGGAAEINGKGFSGMRFITRSVSNEDYSLWTQKVRKTGKPLTKLEYENLAKPSENTPIAFYSPVDVNLFNNIIMKYMVPVGSPSDQQKEGEKGEYGN